MTNADAENERSYHVLYQLVAGSPLTAGKGCEHFRMLTQSGTTTIPGRDDKEEFNKLQIALGWFGMDPAVQKGLWEVLLGALHLGNVTFDGPADEPAVITPATEPDLAHAERLLGIAGLRSNLIEKEITAGGSETMTLQLKPLMAMHARDALVKQLYVRVFDHIVHTVNDSLKADGKSYSNTIGLLDVFGFESFKRNSFEQLCINYANERLHSFFMAQVFEDELALYTREGLPVPDVSPPDNAEVCAIFDKQHVGCFQLLDSQSRMANPADKAFTSEVHTNHEGNKYFGGKDSQLLHAMKLTVDEAFVVHHFAASVVYSTEGFLDKNDNKLSDSFEASLRKSEQPFIAAVRVSEAHHAAAEASDAAASAGGGPKMAPPPALPGSSGFSSVGKTFLNDLRKLMKELQMTMPHFVRCLKPNHALAPKKLEGQMVLVQMASSGLLEAVKLMQASYPSRSTYEELLRIFGNQLPKSTQSLPQAQQVHTSTPLLTSTIPTPSLSHSLPPPLPSPFRLRYYSTARPPSRTSTFWASSWSSSHGRPVACWTSCVQRPRA